MGQHDSQHYLLRAGTKLRVFTIVVTHHGIILLSFSSVLFPLCVREKVLAAIQVADFLLIVLISSLVLKYILTLHLKNIDIVNSVLSFIPSLICILIIKSMDPQQEVGSLDAFDPVPLAPPYILPNAERTMADDHKVLWSQPKHEGRSYGRFEEPFFDTVHTEIRPLRLEGANVIISLSTHPEDILLIHSTILELSPYFKTGLSYRWSTSGKQISTDSQVPAAETIVHKYGLVLDVDREGYTLVGNVGAA